MAKFSYIVRDNSGKKITGSEEGVNIDEVISRLQQKGLLVISVIPEAAASAAEKQESFLKTKAKKRHPGISNEDLMFFCRQLSTLLGSGVAILKSMEIISQQVASQKLYNIIKNLQKDMEGGLSLHEALAKYPKVFSDLWVNLIESGEASGNLAAILTRLAGYLERNAGFKKKVISALIYPAILMCAGIGALLFLTIKIIPTFAQLFAGFNIKLPLITQILILISNFIRKYFLVMIGAGIGGFFIFKNYIGTKAGRRSYESFQLSLPIFGEFFRAIIVERFSSSMATLIESGVPILYSLEIAERSVGNLTIAEIIHKIKEEVRDGKPLSQPLEKSGFFDPLVVQMVTVGEEIGELAQMFGRINVFYQETVETFLARLTSMFEPIMLIVMGGLIGVMVLGMFLPIFQIAQIAGGG